MDSSKFIVNEEFEFVIDTPGEDFDCIEIKNGEFSVIKNNESHRAFLVENNGEKEYTIRVGNKDYQVVVKDHFDQLLEKLGFDSTDDDTVRELKAPMPGLILDIIIQEGQEVNKGDQLLILEAMKMENVIKAAGTGIVKKIAVTKGNAVEKNELLIEFE